MSPHALLAAALVGGPAWAGYGDVDAEGYPSWNDRALHLWTNAARVAPDEFEEDYNNSYHPCSFDDFTADEQTPKAPLFYSPELNEAGRYHSEDMRDNNHFAHESSDGTSFASRLSRFYDSGYVGENIAYGYADEFDAMMGGWMCSDGHRANIMSGGYTELGTGVAGTYYTQDFGGGTADSSDPVAMGAHWPQTTADEADFFADWHADAAPASLQVVVDGKPWDLSLLHGAADMGIYSVTASPESADCHEYYFWWQDSEGTEGTFPEDGSYLYGTGCDNERMWVNSQSGSGSGGGGGGGGGLGDGSGSGDDGGSGGAPGADFDVDSDDISLVGCSSLPARPTGLAALMVLGLAALGRRRARTEPAGR